MRPTLDLNRENISNNSFPISANKSHKLLLLQWLYLKLQIVRAHLEFASYFAFAFEASKALLAGLCREMKNLGAILISKLPN